MGVWHMYTHVFACAYLYSNNGKWLFLHLDLCVSSSDSLQGRKKKQYIDKKNSVTFNLVHRSQNDPHLDETGETQHVLASKVKRGHVNYYILLH